MPPKPRPALQPASVEALLEALRRGQRQVARGPRAAVEAAVSQLLRSAAAEPRTAPARGSRPPANYRIDDLARITGVTTRNIRAYQERGLLHAPTRVGRVALFDDTHLARLRLIASMLERGYTSQHIREMLTAWEHGRDLADVLGVEEALVRPWADDQPATMTLTEVRTLAGDDESLDRLVRDKLVVLRRNDALVQRPKLLRAFAEMRTYGVSMDTVIELHERIEPLVDRISQLLVDAGAQEVAGMLADPAAPSSEELTELISRLVRFRTLAMAAVTASFASSLERAIEKALGDYLVLVLGDVAVDDAG